ncbi:PKD domain containing protein [Alloalcanivorax dieselolei B5]|uniref:PKD domain containing protein n=1 Tax=Alcanivorax dieselolei (strain DSM 16502 / CGMCC 1.3690 / MCCC 1A00001 / B-5) TaxID=930169 RepID=K0CB39_ALCDB|nr:DUF4124 domain-containing protein [Alloalcanivorax dieselolei]AFT68907.1 PKD domain containing protein [Alloalcanivorax dieselolei B5]GGJ81095.1 hypothetical protein GCM10007426_07590 [Alloalcanivorax dieselolei]
MKTTTVLLITFMGVCAAVSARADAVPETRGETIFRSVDEHGNVTFTDAPPEGRDAEAVRIGPTNTVPGPQRARPSAEPPESSQPVFGGYQRLAIVSPQPNATVRNPEGAISVEVALEPALQAGHRLEILDNGKPLSGTALRDPERGSHVLVARVLDQQGKELKRSAAVTVHVHRTSRLQSGRAPAPSGRAGIGQAAQRGGAASPGSGSALGSGAKAGSPASVGQPATRAQTVKPDS